MGSWRGRTSLAGVDVGERGMNSDRIAEESLRCKEIFESENEREVCFFFQCHLERRNDVKRLS